MKGGVILKRIIRIVSLSLVLAIATSLCACSGTEINNSTETTTTATETTPVETTVPTPTPEPTPTPDPTPTPEPTATPTPAPMETTYNKVLTMLPSTLGKKTDKALEIVGEFLGKTPEESFKNEDSIMYSVDIVIEGVHFDTLTFQFGKKEKADRVVLTAFSNTKEEKAKIESYYSKFNKLLKKRYKKTSFSSKSELTCCTAYYVNKKYETNTGWYYDGVASSFWINFYLK